MKMDKHFKELDNNKNNITDIFYEKFSFKHAKNISTIIINKENNVINEIKKEIGYDKMYKYRELLLKYCYIINFYTLEKTDYFKFRCESLINIYNQFYDNNLIDTEDVYHAIIEKMNLLVDMNKLPSKKYRLFKNKIKKDETESETDDERTSLLGKSYFIKK